jgi:Contractile injection system tube protein
MANNTVKPKPIEPQKRQPQLKKAILKAYNNESDDIEFMFNPTELSFTRAVKWESKQGNRGTELLPKVNFSGVDPYKFTLKQLLFDTYETKKSVMEEYVNKIKKGVETIQGSPDQRPPVYIFRWGDNEYFHCVITSLTYTLNMFLTDGTPVRAMVDISLQEVDKNNPPGGRASSSTGSSRRPDPRIRSPR